MMTDSLPKTSHRPRGFTLMELMVVLFILGLLMAIVVPGIGALLRVAQASATKANIELIDKACGFYKLDFNHLPPSSGGQGAAQLTLLLTGYAHDENNDGTPVDLQAESGALLTTLAADDGVPGYGFRVIPAGNTYGPYNGTEEIDRIQNPEGHPVFSDAFGGIIYYYRAENTDPNTDITTYAYEPADESDPAAPLNVDANYPFDADGQMYRKDFILLSAGPDQRFVSLADDPTTDDITNFFDD
jgi:prepilin-type N-terminal cleavage/methylation domain-containing protein